MYSPFECGNYAEDFKEILRLRFAEWVRLRRNRLARVRYREKKAKQQFLSKGLTHS